MMSTMIRNVKFLPVMNGKNIDSATMRGYERKAENSSDRDPAKGLFKHGDIVSCYLKLCQSLIF